VGVRGHGVKELTLIFNPSLATEHQRLQTRARLYRFKNGRRVNPTICLSIYLSIYIYISKYLYIHMSIYKHVYLYIYIYTYRAKG